jgi:hypothetical protein
VTDGERPVPPSPLERFSPEIKLAARLIPWLGDAFAQYADDVIKRRHDKLRRMEEEFSRESGESIDALFARAVDEPRLGDLLAESIDSAQRTSSAAKLKSLGRLLAQGFSASDAETVDEVELLYSAIRGLESAHIRVLHLLVTEGGRYQGVPDYRVAQLFPDGVRIAYAILKTLERHGLAGPQSPPSPDPDVTNIWVPWDFGIFLYERLLAEGLEA